MTKVNFPRVFMGDNGDSGSYNTPITQEAWTGGKPGPGLKQEARTGGKPGPGLKQEARTGGKPGPGQKKAKTGEDLND